MHQSDYQIVLASDQRLFEKVKHLTGEKRAFIIRADKSFRHCDRLIRMLRFSYEGATKTPRIGLWTRFWDAFYSGDVFGCLGLAIDNDNRDDNYNWRYEYTPESVDLIFDPPQHPASS